MQYNITFTDIQVINGFYPKLKYFYKVDTSSYDIEISTILSTYQVYESTYKQHPTDEHLAVRLALYMIAYPTYDIIMHNEELDLLVDEFEVLFFVTDDPDDRRKVLDKFKLTIINKK